MTDLPKNLMWTTADLEGMTLQQVKGLFDAGELNHLLAGNELPQDVADALKAAAALEAGDPNDTHNQEWLNRASSEEVAAALRDGRLNHLL